MFKRRLGYGSLTKVVELVKVDAMREISLKLAKHIGLKGSINLQFRKIGEEYVLLEINPRLSSTVYLRNYFGFTDIKWWLDLLEGKSFSYVPKYRSGVAVRRVAEIFFDIKPLV